MSTRDMFTGLPAVPLLMARLTIGTRPAGRIPRAPDRIPRD